MRNASGDTVVLLLIIIHEGAAVHFLQRFISLDIEKLVRFRVTHFSTSCTRSVTD